MTKRDQRRPDDSPHVDSAVNNPFGFVGSPVRRLITPRQLGQVFDQAQMAHLAELALGSPHHHHRSVWFQDGVLAILRPWLENAGDPSARQVADELEALKRLIDGVLPNPTPSECGEVANLVAQLSPSAEQAIVRFGRLGIPTEAQIRKGDYAALLRLYGLIPGMLRKKGCRRHFDYRGFGSQETTTASRPRDTRVEQLSFKLASLYHRATGRLPGRGERAPFGKFIQELLGRLGADEDSESGDKAVRRAIARYKKALIRER